MTKKQAGNRKSIISSLTAKQLVFLYEYIRNGFNATAAADFAKYANPNTAGPRLLKNPKIIRALDFEVLAPAAMDAEEVISRLSEQARGEYADYFYVGERRYSIGDDIETRTVILLNFEKLIADGKGHLIKGVKQTQYGQQIELQDAHTALVDMGRVHGLFKDKTDLTSGGDKIRPPVIYIPDNGRNPGNSAK